MTPALFAVFLAIVILGGFVWVRICTFAIVAGRFSSTDAVAPPTAATIAVVFALFVAFGASEVTQRGRELNLAVQKEVSVTRSIFKFAESVGPSAGSVRQAMIEYLQAITTLEQAWLEHVTGTESPAQDAADTMVQTVTLFITHSTAPPLIKSLLVTKVDELRQARTERISLSMRSSAIPQWVGLAAMASLTQLALALGYVGKLNAMRAAVGSFTVAATVAICYLAWIDGLIGPSKVHSTMQPLLDVLSAIAG